MNVSCHFNLLSIYRQQIISLQVITLLCKEQNKKYISPGKFVNRVISLNLNLTRTLFYFLYFRIYIPFASMLDLVDVVKLFYREGRNNHESN